MSRLSDNGDRAAAPAPLVVVEASEPLALSPPLLGRHLDRPAHGPLEGELVLAGWALSADGPLRRVFATVGAARPLHVPVDRGRPDIAVAFPDLAHAERSGFRLWLPAGLAPGADIVLAAELLDGARVPIWRIAIAPAHTTRDQPPPSSERRSRLRWGRRRGAHADSPPTPDPGPATAHEPLPSAESAPTTRAAPTGASKPAPDLLGASPRVVAIISAFNEADIIEPVLEHLASNGICSYLIDNGSTDETMRHARRWLGRGLLGAERLANPPDGRTSWRALLARKVELARELGADWYIHHDADEIRESPWPGVSLREAIGWVDQLGFNAIDFRVLNFPPVDDTFRAGMDPRRHFTRWEEPAEYDRLQRKCWKAHLAPDAELAEGGHDVRFAARRVFPLRFLLRHYPIRGQAHGMRKVLRERRDRFATQEIALGWHRQYDHISEPHHMFLRNPASLRPFDLDQLRLETMLADGRARPVSDGVVDDDASPGAVSDSAAPNGGPESPRAQGFLELVSPTTISGWATLSDAGAAEAATVQLWDGARVFATAIADKPRRDLAERGMRERAGFTVRTPRELLDGRPHWIWATVAGTGVGLHRSPLVLHAPGRVSLARAGATTDTAGAA